MNYQVAIALVDTILINDKVTSKKGLPQSAIEKFYLHVRLPICRLSDLLGITLTEGVSSLLTKTCL